MKTAEQIRLDQDARREQNWKRWGPYLSERQWGTVREDYSPNGACWDYFPHDHARSRAYRWGEDGLLGITDRECRLCFSLALWNGVDPILKERLFGLTGPEGNHGEDVKECYYYLDATPTSSYLKALYKYPQTAFPYQHLVDENRARGKFAPEFELTDTGIFDRNQYFDLYCEYAKNTPNDLLIRITVHNHADQEKTLHLLPTIWFRNTWSWGRSGEAYTEKPSIIATEDKRFLCQHSTLGAMYLEIDKFQDTQLLITQNETNLEKLFGAKNDTPYVKDSFHDYVVEGKKECASSAINGTKAAYYRVLTIAANSSVQICLRLYSPRELVTSSTTNQFGRNFEDLIQLRINEAQQFYADLTPAELSQQEAKVMRQSYAGLLWSKQFYHYSVQEWLEGDPTQPKPDKGRTKIRNSEWKHLYNRDIISMPDKWEYPWYAAWDLAFHMLPMSKVDPVFAKQQLILMLREWYMHPNGQIPAYEFAFSDVNPPVHAWAVWRVYKMTAAKGQRDHHFLARAFQKLVVNFTWWINRKDIDGRNLFSGGFLGLDNIGIFDRSKPLPTGGHLEQADATAWMAFYCATMLAMALELAKDDLAYGDMASKFFEHYVAITDAINSLGGTGLWDQLDGFYYDQLHLDQNIIPLRIRSMVGIIPLFAVEVLDDEVIDKLPGFKKRMKWFIEHRPDLAKHITNSESSTKQLRLLAVPSKERLLRVLRYVLDPNEFLSPFGVRSLSRVHETHPYVFKHAGQEYGVDYVPGDSTSALFGGNSNWRGPVWFPLNYLLIESLQRYHYFYGDSFLVECPTGSGQMMNLRSVASEIAQRLSALFLPDANGIRPCHGNNLRYANDPNWQELILFYEYFNGNNGLGHGASHQTGWTALVTRCLEHVAWERSHSTNLTLKSPLKQIYI